MNLQRREEISALLAEPVTGGAGQVLEYRDALMECRAHIDALEQAAAERAIRDGSRGPEVAPAVVVPELPTWEDGDNKLRRGEKLTALEKFVLEHDWHKTDTRFRDGLEAVFAELRAIPDNRVLGEGMLSIHPDALNSISDALREIGDTAHNASTGPEVPDVLWGIREKAYEAYIVATDAEAEIVQTANARAALSSLRANQGGAAA